MQAALLRSGRGDEAAFAEFYDSAAGFVYGIVLKVIKDPAMSEEVSQEVFLDLWKLAPRFEPSKGSVKGWVSTIAHRKAVDRVRSEQSRRNRDEQDLRDRPRDYDVVVETVTQRMEYGDVAVALETLTDTQREAVTLAYYGGHTYREVAAMLAVPEGTIKTRIRDGLIKLRDQFGVTA